jgi:hypothetical protein
VPASAAGSAAPAAVASSGTVSGESIARARRLGESVIIAVVTSTGLYLVGSVYTDAYYGRMSIEATSLDLPPTFIGLQSTHVLQGLIEYPSTILLIYLLIRWLSSWATWLRTRFEHARRRFERPVLLIINLLVISPLAFDAYEAVDQRVMPANSAVSEISVLLLNTVFILLIYVIWLSLGPRQLLFSQIRRHKIVPIVLVGIAYLGSALITTADSGLQAAELFLLGNSEASLAIEFAIRREVPAALPETELLLVAARNGNYFVVERQTYPPSGRPASYIVPFDAVEFAHVQRLNAAPVMLDAEGAEIVDFSLDVNFPQPTMGATPAAP